MPASRKPPQEVYVTVSAGVPPATIASLDAIAREEATSRSTIVRRAVLDYVKAHAPLPDRFLRGAKALYAAAPSGPPRPPDGAS